MAERVATAALPSGQTVQYRERQGEGAGTERAPVVFLAANPGDSLDWEAAAPAVAATGRRTVAVDWPGYGGSPLPASGAATPSSFFDVFVELADALQLTHVVLVGNSVGGYVATRYAAAFPDRVVGVVLVSPGGFTRHTALTRAFCRLQGSRWSFAPRTFASLYLKRKRTPTVQAMLQRAAGPQAAPAVVAMSRGIWRFFIDPAHDLRTAVAPQVRCPALLIFGRHDPVIPPTNDGAQAQLALPQAAFHVLDTGHAPFAEDPDAFLAVVLPFLASLPR